MSYQTIQLIDLTKKDFILGSSVGNNVLDSLRSNINSQSKVLELSFNNIRGVDACFVRNSIATYAKLFCGEVGVVISHVENIDVMENLIYGFNAKSAPLLIKNIDGSTTVHSDLTTGAKALLSYAYSKNETSTHQIVKDFGFSAPNASAKLKKLHKAGYLLADKREAPTGGLEYVYSPFFKCSSLNHQTLL
jgi:hypothetical protein